MNCYCVQITGVHIMPAFIVRKRTTAQRAHKNPIIKRRQKEKSLRTGCFNGLCVCVCMCEGERVWRGPSAKQKRARNCPVNQGKGRPVRNVKRETFVLARQKRRERFVYKQIVPGAHIVHRGNGKLLLY